MTQPIRLSLAMVLALASPGLAADWPMWRGDAQRSAVSPADLPPALHLHWTRTYPPETPAWPDQEKMPFDICFEPIVAGQTIYLNSARHDCVRAVDAATGERNWTFFAEGPVRFAPLFHKGSLYFTSDDGHLYCLDAQTGDLRWKIRGGPTDRRILGNERLISTWPARGAPVIADDGTLYFAASIWPFMGVFIHAVDPATGRIVWTNDGDGSVYMKQPHSADAFASVAPQGPFVVDGDLLIVPGGRSIPAIFDRRTGKLLKLPLAENGKTGGGSEVVAFRDVFFNGGAAFDLKTSKYQGNFSKVVVPTAKAIFAYENGQLKAYDPATNRLTARPGEYRPAAVDVEPAGANAKASKTKVVRWDIEPVASIPTPALDVMIQSGRRIYGGGDGFVAAFDFDEEAGEFQLAYKLPAPGKVCRLIAGADRLIAGTREGTLICFGGEKLPPRHHRLPESASFPESPTARRLALGLLDAGRAAEGYAVLWGLGDGALANELIGGSKLRFVAIESDADKVLAVRRIASANDLSGSRLSVISAADNPAHLPPYFASVVFAVDLKASGIDLDEGFLTQSFQSLRPFGGRLVIPMAEIPSVAMVESWASRTPQARTQRVGEFLVVSRDGPLPGSANWTHEHADSSNTRVGKDVLVKAPMGILWFGGPSHEGILPRHGHGPQPQVIDGRIIVEGVDMMRALDIYTGRLLWETRLPGVGAFYNNVAHQAGANASGSNFVSTNDGIYVAWRDTCVVLDPETGAIRKTFHLPRAEGASTDSLFGHVSVEGDYLIAGADPTFDAKALPPAFQPPGSGDDDRPPLSKSLGKVVSALRAFSDNMSASRRLVVMNRHTGQVVWQAKADFKFRHNGICVGGGRVYAVDRMGLDERSKIKGPLDRPYTVRAFDLATGRELWKIDDDVFGTWLSYSAKHDVLVEAGRLARDTLRDEPRGVRALDARTGRQLWFEKDYGGPAMIRGEEILLDSGACDLRTGALKMRKDPITGEDVPWKWVRTYGCNTPAASEHLLTFRSGAAGYFDLCNDGGTGNFGGFRSSCTNNLVVAGGILTVPEYTRTCTCNYQNQTSVALVHMPDAEMWTYFGSKDVKGRVKRLGINLGAAGDRRAETGTLWLEFPIAGGVSPIVNVAFQPKTPATYRRFSGNFSGPYAWVASSGIVGAVDISIPLAKSDMTATRRFTVRLVFAEPDDTAVGQRKMHVDIQGVRRLSDLDLVAAAGRARQSVIREFREIEAGETLSIRIAPASPGSLPPILSGVEIVEDDPPK